MSIKTRFLLSYVGLIIIAITLLLASVFLFSFAITGDAKAVEQFITKVDKYPIKSKSS